MCRQDEKDTSMQEGEAVPGGRESPSRAACGFASVNRRGSSPWGSLPEGPLGWGQVEVPFGKGRSNPFVRKIGRGRVASLRKEERV